MSKTLLRTNKEIREIYDRNFDSLFKISYMYLKSKTDAEDIIQNVFIKLIEKTPEFNDLHHEKAWLFKVTINMCKNNFKTWWNKKVVYEEMEQFQEQTSNSILEYILLLDKKYKDVIYLYYYEGYNTKEIAIILNKKESTIRSLLKRARELLKTTLKEELL